MAFVLNMVKSISAGLFFNKLIKEVVNMLKYSILDDLNDILFNYDSINEFENKDELLDAIELNILEYYNLY